MATQHELYEQFKALHEEKDGFIMPNPWDRGVSVAHETSGLQSTGNVLCGVGIVPGRLDGRHAVSREEHLTHALLLGKVSGLPVNGDFEDGYGETAQDVAATVEAAIKAGLAGIGIEDTSGNPEKPIRDFDEAVERVRAAAKAARGRIVLTGRTDNYIQGRPDLQDTIKRLVAFAEIGADVLIT